MEKTMEQSRPRLWAVALLLLAGFIGVASPWTVMDYLELPSPPEGLQPWVSGLLVVLGIIGLFKAYRYANTDQSQQ